MDEKKEIQLREWEQRYESYRAYRGQYLTVLSIVATGYIVGISLATSDYVAENVKAIIFLTILVGLIFLGIAHVVAVKAINILGQRMEVLQNTLGMKSFDNVWLLRTALRVTLIAMTVAFVLTLAAAIYLQS